PRRHPRLPGLGRSHGTPHSGCVTPFLFDNNLSRALVPRLADVFPGCLHVSTAGLESALDEAIWQFARDRGYTIVSKDNDFQSLVLSRGARPRRASWRLEMRPHRTSKPFSGWTHGCSLNSTPADDSLLVLREPFT